MLVGRITKDQADIRRVTIDFITNGWLDSGEVITAITTPTIAFDQTATWQSMAYLQTPPLPPVDSTPLTLTSSVIVTGGQLVQLWLANGTPGLTYKVSFVATGSTSSRQKQIDVLVAVREPV